MIYVFAGSIKFLISFKRKITDSCFNFIGGRSLSSLFFSCSRIQQHLQLLNTSHISLREKCLYSELFWSAFFCIWNDCREIEYLSKFIPNVGKWLIRITPNIDTFCAVSICLIKRFYEVTCVELEVS